MPTPEERDEMMSDPSPSICKEDQERINKLTKELTEKINQKKLQIETENEEVSNGLAHFSNEDLIKELTRRIGTKITTSISIFINSDGYEITETNRSPESLKSVGISMKNVFREFIR